MPHLEHLHHHVPVTALAFSSDEDLIFSGEGNVLCVYDAKTQRRLSSLRIFERQAIHGILATEADRPSLVVWGGCLVRTVRCTRGDGDAVVLELRALRKLVDWVLDAALGPVPNQDSRQLVAFVTAHNALTVVDLVTMVSEDGLGSGTVAPLVAGTNCLLYCAHIQWLSAFHCLIASGTAFGDVIIWSASLLYNTKGGECTTSTQTHYNFSAHEGSVFGVQLSPLLTQGELGGCERALATCSDDRMVKLWDISKLSAGDEDDAEQLERDTGYHTLTDAEEDVPRCLAKAMGHVSRIWHVRFLASPLDHASTLHLLSFGEDATTISWRLQAVPELASKSLQHPAYHLEQCHVAHAHAGKHIWSVAISRSGRVVTGGADGAIALRASSGYHPIPLEISTSLLGAESEKDAFKAYSFVAPSTLLATTSQGKVVTLRVGAPGSECVVPVTEDALPGLRGYSVTASIPDLGIAWLAGLNGKVHMYIHARRELHEIIDTVPDESLHEAASISHKTAGLFACQLGYETDPLAVGLVVTRVGLAEATLLVYALDLQSELEKKFGVKQAVRLELADGLVVTSFVLVRVEGREYAVLGSRGGCLAVYDTHGVDSPDEPLRASSILQVHGKEAVTSLHWASHQHHSSPIGLLHSTGRDGMHAVHRLSLTDGTLSLELVHCLALPFGPNIEGWSFRPDDHIWVWGFRGKHFAVYDTTAQREIMTVVCGGAHRNWAFQPSAEGGAFAWTQAGKLYQQQQAQLPYALINPGGHGREIKALAVVRMSREPRDRRAWPQIIATGAEDTNVKLWTFRQGEGFQCLQTLRKHNTGIQHLQWSHKGRYLFSSGGFEEFYVWRVIPGLPGVGVGVFCHGTYPNSGTSDLRIMGFDADGGGWVDYQENETFTISMAYSDSTVQRWLYETDRKRWTSVGQGDYLTACLTHALSCSVLDRYGPRLVTAATDGHLAVWHADTNIEEMRWRGRHKIHQNAILSVATDMIMYATPLVLTGGDDGAIGITTIRPDEDSDDSDDKQTLLVPRAHAAAVTGLAIVQICDIEIWFASVSIDQRLKLWQIEMDPEYSMEMESMEDADVRSLASASTSVADVSCLEVYDTGDELDSYGLLVAGVGMELWRVVRSGLGPWD